MKNKMKKLLSLGLVGTMAAGTLLTGCGSKSASDPKSFTYLIDQSENSVFYENYEDGPVQKYWMDKFGIKVDFVEAIQGAQQDNLNTMLATGEYPDVMSLSYSSESAMALYEEDIVLDLTDYVKEYMPNYLALVDELGLENQVTNVIDGEKKYLHIRI